VRDSPGEPFSGWISAAIIPLEPGPNRTSTLLARAQLGHPEAAQGFHVHEDIRVPSPQVQETESAKPVEPLTLRPARGPLVGVTLTLSPRRQHLRRMDCGGFVQSREYGTA